MGGFGYGPFGRGPFGESAWGTAVRYDLLPAVYRTRDAENGFALQQYAEGVRVSYDAQRRLIRDLPLLRDPLKVPGQYTTRLPIRLGAQVLRFEAREQYGVDGSVLALREFVSPSARFSPADREKHLVLTRSANPVNNRTVRIALVVNSTTILTDPALEVDAGPLQWEVRASSERAADHVVLELCSGDPLAIRPGWVLFDGESEFEVVARAVFPDRTDPHVPPVALQGLDGSIDATGRFNAPTLSALSGSDYGRPIALFDSPLLANRGRFLLGPIEAPGVLRLLWEDGTPATLEPDAGPLPWAVLPRPQITVRGPAVPLGVQEQAGLDLAITAGGTEVTASALSGRFTARDTGKVITLLYPTAARLALVTEVLSGVSVTLTSHDGEALPVGASLPWRLCVRARAFVGDPSAVLLRAPSFLPQLAGDFGLTIDRQESDLRQRSWVQHVAAWTLLKGTAEGYRAVGALSGAEVTPEALFRVSQEVGESLPPEARVELQEWLEHRHGVAGALTSGSGGVVRFSDPAARFRASDVGAQLRLADSATSGNNKLYTIARVVSPTAVEFRVGDTAALPDAGLTWYALRLYATRPPLMARCDDFDADLMESLLDGPEPQVTDVWSIDRYGWESGTVSSLAVEVLAVTGAPPSRYLVTVEGRADVVTGVGAWKVVDAEGRSFFLETVPVVLDPTAPSFTFEVATLSPPALGAASLVYVFAPALSCDYCAASKVRLTVRATLDGASPQEAEQFHERLLRRIGEVLPEHVEAIPLLTATAEATFGGGEGLTAELEIP